jgi:hypothetical protein
MEGKTALALAKDLGLEEIAERIEKYKIEKIKTTKGEGFIPQIEKFEIPTQKEKQKSTNEEQQKKV